MHHILLHAKQPDQSSAIHRLARECSFILPELLQAIARSDGLKKMNKFRFMIHDSIILSSEINDISSFSSDNPIRISSNGHKDNKIVLANARYVTELDYKHLEKVFNMADADILAIEVDADLCGFREKIAFNSTGNIVGLRRIFSDSIVPSSMPDDWPVLLFISSNVLRNCPEIGIIPEKFSDFINLCTRHSLTSRCLRVAGISHDLYCINELLDYLEKNLTAKTISTSLPSVIAHNSIIKGKILAGNNVIIGQNTLLIGPCVIGDNTVIGDNAIIRNSIIGHNLNINDETYQHCFVSSAGIESASYTVRMTKKNHLFKSWPWYSYAGSWKRLIDILFAFIILLMSIPVFIIVAIAIKYSSPGPVFFKHKRQGLHGKDFYCIKFRTMIVGADDIQDQLRKINEVDGPQFKMDDDPRVNAIGKFLRDTCIDEIPQFINVLKGEMSVIGPRPSPEKENTFCAYWRDARLSVRPGITGLWQVMRTRKEGQDFQEWVIHDTSYVKNISLKNDINICLLTVKHIFKSILEQF